MKLHLLLETQQTLSAELLSGCLTMQLMAVAGVHADRSYQALLLPDAGPIAK